MSIRLLQSIFIAGVLSPVDGSTLSLSAALEADLVNQGKATWVAAPALSADVGKEVAATIDPSTRRLGFGAAPIQVPNPAQDIIVAGDSMFVFGEDFFTVLAANLATAITFDGVWAYVNFTSHGLQDLQKIYVLNAAPDGFCGEKVATRIDANNFKFPCSLAAGTVVTMPDNGYGGLTWTGVVFMRQSGYCAANPFYVANALAGHPFHVVRNVAVNSRTAYQMEQEAARDILAHPAPWVVTSAGANEVRVAGKSVAVAVAAAQSYLTRLLNGGKRIIYQAWLPLTPGGTVGLQTIQFNAAMAKWCAENGIIYVDGHAACIDPTSATGQAASGVMAQIDGVHVAPPGAERVAAYHLAAWLGKVFPRRILPTSAAESIANDAGSRQMYRNPLLLTATGGSNTTGLTGTSANVAANVALAAPAGAVTGSASVVARSVGTHGDAFGNAQRVVVTSTNASEVQVKFTFTAGDFAAGDEIFGALAVDASGVSGANLVLCGLYLELAAATTRYFGDMKAGNGLGTNQVYAGDFRKTLVTPRMVVNAAVSTITLILWLQFSAAGSAVTIDCGRPAIFKV